MHAEISAPVTYLPEYLHDDVAASGAPGEACGGLAGYRAARSAWWRDFRRDPTRNRMRRFGQALVLAAELPRDVVHLHAHFLHTPASVTRYAALLRDLPLELLGAREGHLDAARMGEAGEARDVRVDDDVHGVQRRSSAQHRRRRDATSSSTTTASTRCDFPPPTPP